MLVEEDDVNHQEVAANTNNEDNSVQAEEDHLHPVLVKVELLAAAHLLKFMILFHLSTSDSYFLVVATISEQYNRRTICKM